MNYSLCIRTINEMIRQGKLIKDANRYRFNENYKEWNVTSNGTITRNNILTKSNENITKSNCTLTKSNTTLTKSNGPNHEQNMIESTFNAQKPLRKENIKE
ncbi:MAG: hypothetical protein GYA51_01970, partial [Candidatus Methanofastidiosa archaeon]|nr:hypothetical protein [Candidatus Methanofastidiosa archaeon]